VAQDGFDPRTLEGLTVQSLRAKLEKSQSSLGCEVRTADLTDTTCDGPQTLVFYYVLAIEIMEQMFGDPNYKGKFVYEARPTFDKDGVRTYDELASGE
jgi:hypothetical protein